MYLFFDTETNGLPTSWKASAKEVDNWPRVIQLAFIITDTEFNEEMRFCELIKPDGWTIPNEKFWIDNGYSTETNARDGVNMTAALTLFNTAVNKCTHMFAHNLAFDHPVMGAEMYRYEMFPENRPNRVCTMRSSTDYCAIPGARGGYKWPKLEELHQKLFGVKFDNAHDALADVSATVRCAKELANMGYISL